MAEHASNQSTDTESVEMQKQIEDMFSAECTEEEENASIKSPGPEGLHTMLTTHHPELLISLETIRETYLSMELPSDASFDGRTFKRFVAGLLVSQQTTKEDGDAVKEDSKVQSATMLPSSDEHRTITSIVNHSDENVDDRIQETGLHTTVAGHVSDHAEPEVVGQTKNNGGRAEVNPGTLDKEGCGKETYQHMLRTAFKERVFRHKMEKTTFLPVISAYTFRSTDERDKALAATKHMTAQLLPSFDAKLWSGWEKREEDLSYLDVDLFSQFTEFVGERKGSNR